MQKPDDLFAQHGMQAVRTAVTSLTTADALWLYERALDLVSRLGVLATSNEHEDLLHEAYIRTLSGRRHWVGRVEFCWHIYQTMRSIVSSWRKQRLKDVHPQSENGHRHASEDLVDPFDGFADGAPSADRVIAAREMLDSVYDLLTPPEMGVFELWVENVPAATVCARLDLDGKEYGRLMKRIRRKLSRFPGRLSC